MNNLVARGDLVVGNGIIWSSAADLASGQVFYSVLRIKVNKTGADETEYANVAVQGPERGPSRFRQVLTRPPR